MWFKNKSTYRQLAFMFGLLLVVNFMIIIAALRQLTIEPSATQMALFVNMQLSSIEKLLERKNFEEKQKIIVATFDSKQILIEKQPNAKEFPNLKFYRVLSQQILNNKSLPLKLEESEYASKIWIKPQWLDGYWLGIAFQPFIKNVSRLLKILIVTLLSLSLIAAYFFSRYMLKPFKQLAQMAVDIVEQKPSDEQLSISGTKEVKEIAQLVQVSAKKIQQLNKEKELLLAGVSHDLRTPLARMRLQAEFLTDMETQNSMVQDIEEMDAIIGDFVAYVRSGSFEETQNLDIGSIIQETIEQYLSTNKSIEFEHPKDAIFLDVKPLCLKRMLTNIIDNAYKYGKPPVQVEIEQQELSTLIHVVDHGDGLAEHEIDGVFEPFVLAHSTDNQYGSGLGLSIVKKMAQQINATVTAHNHSRGGLCVCIEIAKS